MNTKNTHFDCCVVGRGAIGLATALFLAEKGLSCALIGSGDLEGAERRQKAARTIAILANSLDALYALDAQAIMGTQSLQEQIEAFSAPLRSLRLIDATGGFLRAPTIEFFAKDIGLEAFGRNIALRTVTQILKQRADAEAEANPAFHLFENTVTDFYATASHATLTLATGEKLTASLVVAADGAQSFLRAAASITTQVKDWPQMALTALIRHSRDHGFCSTEFHTRAGPMTFVPLPQGTDGSFRSSLVWLMRPTRARALYEMPDARLAEEIFIGSSGILGEIALEEGDRRGLIAMRSLQATRLYGKRLALVGESAHAFPPIGAQGFNLGLRDGLALAALVGKAKARGQDFGSAMLLRRYGLLRAPDIALRQLAVDGLNRALLADCAPLDALRALGIGALKAIKPLRQGIMQLGMGSAMGTNFCALLRAKPNGLSPFC